MLRVLDLFSGQGMFSLGLERSGGFETVAFCEKDEFCRLVLHKHWPDVPRYDDVCTLTANRLRADGIARLDALCGGFPCQDLSINGRGAGLTGNRSGLWFEYLRLIDECRPNWAIIENVDKLRDRGLDTVLRGIDSIGYDAEWHGISAAAIGADHGRDRIWILAYPKGRRRRIDRDECGAICEPSPGQLTLSGEGMAGWDGPIIGPTEVNWQTARNVTRRPKSRMASEVDGPSAGLVGDRPIAPWEGNTARTVAKGFPNRRKRLIAGGNSIDPDIPELIGRAILQALGSAQMTTS
ncbi:MAG: DNA cytosine methyltransferase [Janthinobacterium lividum]